MLQRCDIRTSLPRLWVNSVTLVGNAGLRAVQYFKQHFADNPACEGGQEESEAEWLVRITTQVQRN